MRRLKPRVFEFHKHEEMYKQFMWSSVNTVDFSHCLVLGNTWLKAHYLRAHNTTLIWGYLFLPVAFKVRVLFSVVSTLQSAKHGFEISPVLYNLLQPNHFGSLFKDDFLFYVALAHRFYQLVNNIVFLSNFCANVCFQQKFTQETWCIHWKGADQEVLQNLCEVIMWNPTRDFAWDSKNLF